LNQAIIPEKPSLSNLWRSGGEPWDGFRDTEQAAISPGAGNASPAGEACVLEVRWRRVDPPGRDCGCAI